MSVSFGKIVIVNAPLRTAQTIANRANYRSNTSVGEQIQTIINDTRFGKAHAFPVCGSKEKSYMLVRQLQRQKIEPKEKRKNND